MIGKYLHSQLSNAGMVSCPRVERLKPPGCILHTFKCSKWAKLWGKLIGKKWKRLSRCLPQLTQQAFASQYNFGAVFQTPFRLYFPPTQLCSQEPKAATTRNCSGTAQVQQEFQELWFSYIWSGRECRKKGFVVIKLEWLNANDEGC